MDPSTPEKQNGTPKSSSASKDCKRSIVNPQNKSSTNRPECRDAWPSGPSTKFDCISRRKRSHAFLLHCRLTKPLSFADCVGDELPWGWEAGFDPQIGVYYIDHVNSKCFFSGKTKHQGCNPLKAQDPPSEHPLAVWVPGIHWEMIP